MQTGAPDPHLLARQSGHWHPGLGWCLAALLLLGLALACLWQRRPAAQLNECISNLKSIEIAKENLAAKNALTNGETVPASSIASFLKTAWPLRCPSGGTYSVNPIGSNATCSTPGHFIP
jgi:hypothetical protein